MAWASHVDLVERLASLAEGMGLTGTPSRPPERVGTEATESIEERGAHRAATLADDARVRAHEIMGDRERAVQIMERRLLAGLYEETPSSS